ncbi:MAG: hypothetical protein IT364_16580 [Candidatus Hydrogenedentes bacterium]|nr:hypothetical protein [Candidatus Hydrogenedentota bacterium]
MFIAIALDVIATPMVVEMAATPEALLEGLRAWCVDEKGEPLEQVGPVFEKQLLDACHAGFNSFGDLASRGFPVVKLPGGGETITIVVQRYDEEA